MVQDIKKNDGGFMNKFRKLTNKGPPSVPTRDYNPDDDNEEDQEWSDSEFDSDYENPDDHSETYEAPEHENDDSYEPPPCEQENRNIAAALPISGAEYAVLLQNDSDYENPDDHSETYEAPEHENDDSYEPPPCEQENRNIAAALPISGAEYAAPPVVNRNAKPTRNHSPAPIRTDKVAEGPGKTVSASQQDGSFLIRKSSGQDAKQPFTLVVFYKKKVYNIPVRYIESSRQYALGKEKTGEERFGSVSGIIENHQKTPLILIDNQSNTKDSTKLKHPVKV
ncbi:UNVERIFIED_CONTAM: hypothetical protein FKN15_033637 [Acipenser sinensis]